MLDKTTFTDTDSEGTKCPPTAIYEDVEGAPVKIGQMVIITGINGGYESQYCIGHIGTVEFLLYGGGTRQVYPTNPLIGIRFLGLNNKLESFFYNELSKLDGTKVKLSPNTSKILIKKQEPAQNTLMSMMYAPKLMQIEEQVLPAAVRLAERILASTEWESPKTIGDAKIVLEGFYESRDRGLRELTHWLKIYRNYDKYPVGIPFREISMKKQIDIRMSNPKVFLKMLESQKHIRTEE